MKNVEFIQRQTADEVGWQQVPYYISQTNGKKKIFFLANLDQPIPEGSNASLESEHYVKIDPPLEIADDQGIWIDPDGNIWVANQENPFIEKEKSFTLDLKLSEI